VRCHRALSPANASPSSIDPTVESIVLAVVAAELTRTSGSGLSMAEPHICAPIDANGNLTSDGTKTYLWNALNQLVEVKEGSTTIATFEYDGEGRRTEKVAAGLTHQYLYDAEDIVEERISRSSSDTIRYHHGIGIDEPLARTNGSSVTTYYLDNHRDV
jgi:YD repeat-containing protein